MRKSCTILRECLIISSLSVFTFGQVISKKVIFPKGKSSIVVQGTLVGNQTIDYVIAAKQGQQLHVELTKKGNDAYFNVLPPGSEGEAAFIGQNSGNKCSMILSQSGIFKIRVYQLRNSAKRGEKVSYSLSISIPVNSVTSGDAIVSGTNYHATGELRATIDSSPATANFGVIRSKGGAEVHATLPGKTKRVFVFSQGEWSCNSENCLLSFTKVNSDEWELIVNNSEKYYIPDAVIYRG